MTDPVWKDCRWCEQPHYGRGWVCRDCSTGSWTVLLILAFAATAVVIALVDLAVRKLS